MAVSFRECNCLILFVQKNVFFGGNGNSLLESMNQGNQMNVIEL